MTNPAEMQPGAYSFKQSDSESVPVPDAVNENVITPETRTVLVEQLKGSLGEGDVARIEEILADPAFPRETLADPAITRSVQETFRTLLSRNLADAVRLNAILPLQGDAKNQAVLDAVIDRMRIGHAGPALKILQSFDLPEELLANREIQERAFAEYQYALESYPDEAAEIQQAFKLPNP